MGEKAINVRVWGKSVSLESDVENIDRFFEKLPKVRYDEQLIESPFDLRCA